MSFLPEFLDFQNTNVLAGKRIISEGFKMIIYKTIPDFFDLLDFDDDDLFLEPLLFAYVHSERQRTPEMLKQLVYGSIEPLSRPRALTVLSDKYGNIYLPKLGWITAVKKSSTFYLEEIEGEYFLDGNPAGLELIKKENKPGVELIRYPLELLADRFFDRAHNFLEVDINNSYKQFGEKFNNGINFIHDNCGWLSGLIEKCCFKAVLFNDGSDPVTDDYCKRNSFASFRIKGISFHNIYQPWYDEVFFLDDISHQMGHIIFDFMTFEKTRFYNVKPDEILKSNSDFGKIIDDIEERSYEIFFHALYTYFTSLIILDTAMEHEMFSKEQKNEIIGRIVLYLRKSALDFETFEPFDKNDIAATIFTEEGLYIYKNMKHSFSHYCEKYVNDFNTLKVNNQSYNYNHKRFLELNNLATVA